MTTHEPGAMCIGATPSDLWYEDLSTEPREIRPLDLRGSRPTPAAGKRVIHTEIKGEIKDMCSDQDRKKELLIVAEHAEGYDGVYAYNAERDEKVWEADGELPGMEYSLEATGVTTDNRGHLFVADYANNCIQMFSVSDGQYLGCVMKSEETYGIKKIGWCEKTSSLVCLSGFEGLYVFYIVEINVQYLSD